MASDVVGSEFKQVSGSITCLPGPWLTAWQNDASWTGARTQPWWSSKPASAHPQG